jgi:hypothetical protein
MNKTMMRMAVAAALVLPAISQATIFQFNASLSRGNEVLTTGAGHADPSGSPATGIATLFYDDKGTVSLADDTYNFAMSAFGRHFTFMGRPRRKRMRLCASRSMIRHSSHA